jgi:hypothetical protein
VRGAVEPIFVEDLAELPATLAPILRDGDVVLTLGAGSIGAAAAGLPRALARRNGPAQAAGTSPAGAATQSSQAVRGGK